LEHVSVVFLDSGRSPSRAVFGLDDVAAIMHVHGAGGAVSMLAHRTPGTLDLSAVGVKLHAIAIFVFDGEVIPNFPRLTLELLPGAHAPAFHRMVFHEPISHIQVMNVLLANMIAAQPDVMVPVADLLLQFGGAVVTPMPDGAGVHPVGPQRNQIAD